MTAPAFRAGTFAGQVGQVFQVGGDPEVSPLDLVLRAVSPWGAESSDEEERRFTLLFNGPLVPILPQRIYRFDHPSIGSFDIFIVPIGPDAGRMQYEAVFS